ncbi:MAG TPA: hypothetical protein VJ546_12075 [Bacillales bacterium]|nr:hypothetical protein [Bacillales bacterium]
MEENRMEEMLSTLISMVGNIRKDQESFKIQLNDLQQDIKALQQDMVIVKEDIVEMKQDMLEMKQDMLEMKQDMLEMKQDILEIKQDILEMKQENEKHHQETLNEFKVLKADLDLIWDKTVRNEREIAKIKCQI